jgi:hypothetical protein
MPHRNVPKKVAKRQKNWDKKLKTLRKRYQAKPKESTTHGKGNKKNTPLSFHMPNVVARGRLKARPVPER